MNSMVKPNIGLERGGQVNLCIITKVILTQFCNLHNNLMIQMQNIHITADNSKHMFESLSYQKFQVYPFQCKFSIDLIDLKPQIITTQKLLVQLT